MDGFCTGRHNDENDEMIVNYNLFFLVELTANNDTLMTLRD